MTARIWQDLIKDQQTTINTHVLLVYKKNYLENCQCNTIGALLTRRKEKPHAKLIKTKITSIYLLQFSCSVP